MIAAILFYLFAAILIISAAMVVSVRNPVHSVLFLILAFFNAAALFLLAGAEFLAMILVIVYVGAVAVLFLFVVMMLDIDFAELRSGFQRYLPVGLAVGAVLLAELVIVLGGWKVAPEAATLRFAPRAVELHNTAQLGRLLYTDYIFLFQTAGLVLLVAMIGAIVLTLRERTGSRRQTIARQVGRSPGDTLELMDIPSRTGVAALGILRPKPAAPQPAAETPAHGGGHP
jgi:NADH-quinone oxidoreductase subunit J